MKHFKLKLALVAAALTFALTPASAYDFTVDGLYYDIVSLSDFTCAVTSGDQKYEGDVTIPSTVAYKDYTLTVVSIDGKAFYQCTGLTNISIPGTVTSVGASAFSGCTGLTSVTIPNSVTSINQRAFYECSSLTSITIPNSVTSIGNSAFYGCSSLTSLTIPNSVTGIGDYAFLLCSSLTSIRVDSGNKVYDSRGDCNAIIRTATNTLRQGCRTTYIPNTVTSIYKGAFCGCSGLTNIIIPNSVTSIGKHAFDRCSDLTSVTIPNSVTSICDGTFYGCSSLTSITIPNSVTSIGEQAFSDCSSLTSLTISTSVESIGFGAFLNCSNLTSIRVASGNKVYDSREDCNAIIETATNTLLQGCRTTHIPNTVTSIGNDAFYGCSGLTNITIPNSVTSIGNSSFYGCTGLTSLVIGSSVSKIDYYAFKGCSGLKNITSFNTTPPTLVDYNFTDEQYESVLLYVPQEAIEVYKAANVWKNFFRIEAVETAGIENVEAGSNNQPADIYDLQGRKLSSPHKGINIIGGKKVLMK